MAKKDPSAKSSVPGLTAPARVIFSVRDLERSARWYEGTLGIPVRRREPGWVELQTRGVALCLRAGRRHGPSPDQPALTFRVDQFDAALRGLKLREVPGLGEPFECGEGSRAVFFEDPDGNRLGIEGP